MSCLSLSPMPGTQSALSRGSWVESVEMDAWWMDGRTSELTTGPVQIPSYSVSGLVASCTV